eukprot:COSAG06_NODE_5921_length_3208_cov_4.923448_2_plen_217_part_00
MARKRAQTVVLAPLSLEDDAVRVTETLWKDALDIITEQGAKPIGSLSDAKGKHLTKRFVEKLALLGAAQTSAKLGKPKGGIGLGGAGMRTLIFTVEDHFHCHEDNTFYILKSDVWHTVDTLHFVRHISNWLKDGKFTLTPSKKTDSSKGSMMFDKMGLRKTNGNVQTKKNTKKKIQAGTEQLEFEEEYEFPVIAGDPANSPAFFNPGDNLLQQRRE